MAKLTKEVLDSVLQELSGSYGVVILRCDGYEVTLTVQRFKAMTYRVMTYINGKFNHAWCHPKGEAPESKFLRKSVRQLYSAKERQEAQKALGKRAAARMDGTYTIYLPDWPTGRAALSHIDKVCDSVEFVSQGYSALADIVREDRQDEATHEEAV